MRLKDYDYTQNGYYFFTICTYKRKCYFGAIRNGVMGLNVAGCMVWEQWRWLAEQYGHVKLDAFIVMPNHVHGILIIDRPEEVSPQRVGTPLAEDPSTVLDIYKIVQAFKSRCSKHIHEAGIRSFRWQRSFYERIIDNDTALVHIRSYITYNPYNWNSDRNKLDKVN